MGGTDESLTELGESTSQSNEKSSKDAHADSQIQLRSNNVYPVTSGLAFHDAETIVRNDQSIPIGFRTLSIHVSESLRVNRPNNNDKGSDKSADKDGSEFFQKLTFHTVTGHQIYQQFNVALIVILTRRSSSSAA